MVLDLIQKHLVKKKHQSEENLFFKNMTWQW